MNILGITTRKSRLTWRRDCAGSLVENNPKKRLVRNGARRRGAATIEMALVAPFIFFMIFSSVEFARMMMMRQALTNAAREGCRHASLVTTQNDNDSKQVLRDRLRATMSHHDDPDIVRVEFTPSFASSPPAGTKITASVEIDCADISWFPGSIFAGAKIRGTSSMNRE